MILFAKLKKCIWSGTFNNCPSNTQKKSKNMLPLGNFKRKSTVSPIPRSNAIQKGK